MNRLDEIRDAIAKDGGKGLLIAMHGRLDSPENQEMLCVIEALTARAEKAERERDAAMRALDKICEFNGSLYCRCNEIIKIAGEWREVKEK